MVLALAGVGLAAFLAWQGMLAASHVPLATIDSEGVYIPPRRLVQGTVLAFTIIQVFIVVLLTLEVAAS